MPRINFNDGQEILHSDLSEISAALEKELLERMGYELGGRQTDYAFGDSFQVSYVSAASVSVKLGLGVQLDGTQADPESKKRLLLLAANTVKALAVADGANPRIDIISIRANRATAATESRNFKDLSDVVSVVSFVTETDWAADLLVTTGTPAGSPVAPATPAGYLKLADLAVAAATGLPVSGGITDKRNVFLPGSSKAAYVSKSAAYTATPEDEVILCTGTFTVTLPPAAICSGKILQVMNMGSGTITIDGNGAEPINADTTQTIEDTYSSMKLLSIATGWLLID